MFSNSGEEGCRQVLEGVDLKTLAYGEKSLLAEFRLKKGSLLPLRSHSQEQTGYMVLVKMRLFIENEIFEVNPGDSWSLPGSAEHKAEIIEDSVVIEVFTPVRE